MSSSGRPGTRSQSKPGIQGIERISDDAATSGRRRNLRRGTQPTASPATTKRSGNGVAKKSASKGVGQPRTPVVRQPTPEEDVYEAEQQQEDEGDQEVEEGEEGEEDEEDEDQRQPRGRKTKRGEYFSPWVSLLTLY